jgi:hypothetical protein
MHGAPGARDPDLHLAVDDLLAHAKDIVERALAAARQADVRPVNAEVVHQVQDLELVLDRRVGHRRVLQAVAQVSSKKVAFSGMSRPFRFTSFQSKMSSDSRRPSDPPLSLSRDPLGPPEQDALRDGGKVDHRGSIASYVGTMTHEALLTAAELQVVQHGSRASFRRRVFDALRSLVQAPAAFCCLGTDDARAYLDSSRLVDGVIQPVKEADGVPLAKRLRLRRRGRLHHRATRIPGDGTLPRCGAHGAPLLQHALEARWARSRAARLLARGGGPFRPVRARATGRRRTLHDADAKKLEALAAFIVAGARAQIAYDELAREASALRALGRDDGRTLSSSTATRRRVMWAADREHGIDWAEDVAPIEEAIVNAAKKLLESGARGEALPTPPRLPRGTVTAVAKIEDDPVFSSARVVVVASNRSARSRRPWTRCRGENARSRGSWSRATAASTSPPSPA